MPKIVEIAKRHTESLRRIKKWVPRFEILSMKMTRKDFCRKHKISETHLCAQLKGRRGGTPECMDRVERALLKEGV